MNLSKTLKALTVGAVVAMGATSASAAVIDFSGGNDGSADGVSLSCSVTGFLNLPGCSVTLNGSGLGVAGGLIDTQPGQVDGFGGTESITISFAQDMVWNGIRFSRWDNGDNALLEADGGVSLSYGGNAATLAIPGVVSSQLTITAIDGGFGQGRDDFRIRAIDVAPVPLPAAGVLLMAGLGGLAFMRRRQQA